MDGREAAQLKLDLLIRASNLPSSLIPQKIKSNLGYISTGDSRRFHSKQIRGKVCEYCLTQLNPENCRVKLKPTIKPGAKVRRILNKIKNKKKISVIERKLATRVHSTKNRLITTCLVCNKSNTRLYRKKKEKIAKKVPDISIIEIVEEDEEKIEDTEIEIIEVKNTNKKIKEVEVSDIQIIQEKTRKKKKKKKRNNSSLNVSDCSTPNFVIDKTGDFSKNKKQKFSNKSPAINSKGFIPLVSSTPTTCNRNKDKIPASNLLNLKAIKTKRDENYLNKRKLGSLGRLIDQDSQMAINPRYSLKNFLSKLK